MENTTNAPEHPAPSIPESTMEAWFKRFEATKDATLASQLFMDLLRSPGFNMGDWEEYDLGMSMIDTFVDLWQKEKKFEETFVFLDVVERTVPLGYWQEYKYIAQHILYYACFTNQPERAEAAFAYFGKDPNADIDLFLPFLYTAWYWCEATRAERLARAAFPSVFANKAEYFGDPHQDLGDVIFFCRLEEVFKQAKKQGTLVDLSGIREEMLEFDRQIPEDRLSVMEQALNAPLDIAQLQDDFNEDRFSFWHKIATAYCAWMNLRGFPFYLAHGIATEFSNYCETHNEDAPDISVLLAIHYRKMDKFLASKNTFLLQNWNKIVLTLWGLPFVSDFLHEHELISAEAHAQNRQTIIDLKIHVLKGLGADLWAHSFPQRRWPKPDSVSEAEYEAEQAIAEASFSFVGTKTAFEQHCAQAFAQLPPAIDHPDLPDPLKKIGKKDKPPRFQVFSPDQERPGFRTPSQKQGSNYTPPKKKKKR